MNGQAGDGAIITAGAGTTGDAAMTDMPAPKLATAGSYSDREAEEGEDDMGPDMSTHGLPCMASAYKVGCGCEPPSTHRNVTFEGCLDYVWVSQGGSGSQWRVAQLLEMPYKWEQLTGGKEEGKGVVLRGAAEADADADADGAGGGQVVGDGGAGGDGAGEQQAGDVDGGGGEEKGLGGGSAPGTVTKEGLVATGGSHDLGESPAPAAGAQAAPSGSAAEQEVGAGTVGADTQPAPGDAAAAVSTVPEQKPWLPLLPNHVWSSDHIALGAVLELALAPPVAGGAGTQQMAAA